MHCCNYRWQVFAWLGLHLLFAPRLTLADGGAIRAIEKSEGLAISVFTSPAILTAGEVDISVLVQDDQSQQSLADTQVQVTVIPREHSYLAERHAAVEELAANRLMKSCHVQLQQGWHEVEVLVDNKGRRGRVDFAMFVGPPLGRAAHFWPWFAWPAVPIILVTINLAYRHLRSNSLAIINRRIVDSATHDP